MQGNLDKVTYDSLDRQLRRIRRRNLLRRYWWILLLFTSMLVFSGYRIYEKGPERWAADTVDSIQQSWERIEAAFTPDYSTAGEGGYFVVKVVDGDTIHVRDDRGTMKVRLHGIDTPERGQQVLHSLTSKKTVFLKRKRASQCQFWRCELNRGMQQILGIHQLWLRTSKRKNAP